jgi:hypothetical protein
MASKEFTTIASKDFQPCGYKTVLKSSKDSKNFESFDTVVSMESTGNTGCAPLVKAVFSKDLESNAYKAYKTVVKPSEHTKRYIDANNTVILLDSKDHNDLVELMCSNENVRPKKKLYCQICCFITAFYAILIFFTIIFVLLCIRFES